MSTTKPNSQPVQDLPGEGSRFSIAGMLIFTAVVAVHVALGKSDIGWVVLLAPFSLSIIAIEILRRMFRLPIVRAMVVGILVGAFCFSGIIGSIAGWDYWFREDYVQWNGQRIVQPPPRFNILFRIFLRSMIGPFVWYVFAGMFVMFGYCGIILFRDSRSKRVVKGRLLQRGEVTEGVNIEIEDRQRDS